MVKVAPFKGISYNKQIIDKPDDVMSPPYDIISEKMQNELYDKHQNNFVKLILGKQFSDDTDNNNRYTRAKQLFEQWQKESILIKSNTPAIYPYKIEYLIDGKKKIMSGFFVLLKLDPDYKYVKAHEKTLSKPKADRLNLMRSCKANLEPIQLLFIDKENLIGKIIDDIISKPIYNVKGYDGFIHKLWKIDDKKVISNIVSRFDDEILFIADGHHRYQTAINYANEQKKITKNKDDNASYNYRMVILVNIFDEGLAILPTHRFIKKSDINLSDLLLKLKKYFTVEEKLVDDKIYDFDLIGKKIIADIKTDNKHKFALYCKDKYYILTLKDEKLMDDLAKDKSKTWRRLDVSILHKIILDKIMGINENNLEDHVKYTRVDAEAIQFVDEGMYDLSFLMNATKIDELKAVAEAGEHMPQKSTYFLPKMLSGLVMYKM